MKRKLNRGRPLSELVKGSLNYTISMVEAAFNKQFGGRLFDAYIVEVFADYVIVRQYEAPPDEYLVAAFAVDDAGELTFAEPNEWEAVELTYQPATPAPAAPVSEPVTLDIEATSDQELASSAVSESAPASPAGGKAARRGRRLDERSVSLAADGPRAQLIEGKTAGGKNTQRIKIEGLMRTGLVNGNGRRYPADVIEAAVAVWRAHLHESAGQGRFMLLTGEADHPDQKGHKTARFIETCVRWDEVTFDGMRVDVAGELILTSIGRDVLTLMEAGVRPGGSVRGFYEATRVREGDHAVEEVTWCEITGADLVGDPSFPNRVDLLESRQPVQPTAQSAVKGEGTMDLEQLRIFIQQHPELFKDVIQGEVKSFSEAQLADVESRVRTMLGVAADMDLGAALQEAATARRELAEARQQQAVAGAIAEACKALPYGSDLNRAFRVALEEAACVSADAVKALAEAKRKEYDAIASMMKLNGMGRGVQVLGSVLEQETGIPEFARAGHAFSEALQVRGLASARNLAQPKTVNERVAQRVMARYDATYRTQLLHESRLLQETELASDLNLPYSAMRTILAEVWPQLVATSIFDVDVTENPLAYVFYEDYQDVSGKHVVITNESVTADHDNWVQMAHRMIEAGTVVVTNSGSTVTYTEGADYVIDYVDGKIYVLSTGLMTDSQAILVDYHYDMVREGENQPIQRAKMITNSTPLVCRANRLATQITREAMLFSRSQIGWDATARTLEGLIKELRREIDRALLYTSLSRALMVASNSGGTYTAATDPLIRWVEYLGAAKVKVSKRYFEPEFMLLSETNSDALGNWDGFTNAGGRVDSALNANGYVYRLKGLPVFKSTEFSDAYCEVGNKQALHYRVYKPGELMGPYPSYDSNGNLIAADQYYVEIFDGWVSPVAGKSAYMKVA